MPKWIRPTQATIVVFYEVALLRLHAHADEHEHEIESAMTAGVDLVGNVGRFLHEVSNSKVQFTVSGKLYRASERRIAKLLLPVQGGYLDAEPQLRFIYGFCLARQLIDRAGERALRPTAAGKRFETDDLGDKLRALLSFCVQECVGPGERR